MYTLKNKEKLNLIVGAKIIQLCLGETNIQIHFQDKDNDYIELNIFQPNFISVDNTSIKSITDYGLLLPFIGKTISDIIIIDTKFSIVFDNIVINISLENNGYEILSINKNNDILII